MTDEEFKALMEVASQWDKVHPQNEYPWHAKLQYKSVKTPFGIALEPIPQPEFTTKETQWVSWDEVETPDPTMIHIA
jgi:hypothetical protein